MIVPSDPWRGLPPMPIDDYDRVMANLSASDRAICRTFSFPNTLLCVAQSGVESGYGTSQTYKETNNLLGLRPRSPADIRPVFEHPTKGAFLIFDHPHESVDEWVFRITNPEYKGGVYTNTKTIQEFINVYCPKGPPGTPEAQNDPVAYAERICADMTFWTSNSGGPVPTIHDLANPAHASIYGVSTTAPGRNDPSKTEQEYLFSRCFPGRGDGSISGRAGFIVIHIQEGATAGSLDWWINGRDQYGEAIEASVTVLVNKSGTIVKCIPEKDGPWTNGDVKSPTIQSAVLRAQPGNPNIWCLTIEAEGYPDQLVPPAQLDSIVWQVNNWCKTYGIPKDRDHILPHSSINSVTRAHCPGRLYELVMEKIGSGAPTQPVWIGGVEGLDLDVAKRLFGSVEVRPNVWATFDPSPKGVLSQSWVDSGKKTLVWGSAPADVNRAFTIGDRTYLPKTGGVVFWRYANEVKWRLLGEE